MPLTAIGAASERPVASKPARRASAIAKSGGTTSFFAAQASRSASVWQQHDRQQCSAESHPQPHDSQGKRSWSCEEDRMMGNGTPAHTSRYSPVSAPAIIRRPERNTANPHSCCNGTNIGHINPTTRWRSAQISQPMHAGQSPKRRAKAVNSSFRWGQFTDWWRQTIAHSYRCRFATYQRHFTALGLIAPLMMRPGSVATLSMKMRASWTTGFKLNVSSSMLVSTLFALNIRMFRLS